jgi:hypothetical protein
VGFISVRESAHLKATVIAMQSADREIQSAIRTETRTVGASVWRDELAQRPAIEQQTRMLVNTARVSSSNNGITLTAATQKRPVLSGGGSPIRLGKAYEFGSRKGRGIPPTRRGGYVIYPALADVAPRLISLWAQTVMRIAHDALEGKG